MKSVTEAAEAQPPVQMPVAPVAPTAGEPPEEPVAPAEPVQAYQMPLAALESMLAAVGLVMVSTDPEKWRVAQEEAARRPVPVRVPRERKPAVVLDEGPLIQVETRR